MVRCPFHGDRNPSLSLNLSKGLWKCHSCGKAGMRELAAGVRVLEAGSSEPGEA